ncbi:hypothetical protein SMICM304S_12101 [Streptomyces microflavus]
MCSPSPVAGPVQRMQEPAFSCLTVDVMSRLVAGVTGLGGTGVVRRNAEPGRKGPWPRRSALVTWACEPGQRSTSVWSFQTVLSGASMTVSAWARTTALDSTPLPWQVRDGPGRGVGAGRRGGEDPGEGERDGDRAAVRRATGHGGSVSRAYG